MVKFILLILITISSFANIYETNCLSCHQDKEQLNTFMKEYTLKYSGEKQIKEAIFRFLKAPTQNRSIMPFEFIQQWGFKEKTTLNDQELQEAIEIYYKKYNLKQFIK